MTPADRIGRRDVDASPVATLSAGTLARLGGTAVGEAVAPLGDR